MIEITQFNFTQDQWAAIKEQVLDDLGVDVDTVPHQDTSLRDRIEVAISKYRVVNLSYQQKPRRADLEALREDTKIMLCRIVDAFAVGAAKFENVEMTLQFPGVDPDMLPATGDYFRKLASNLDRQIEQAGSSGDNARKTARNLCWEELLTVWIGLGGKPRGDAAAEFIKLASLPVMNSAVPDLASVKKWLRRRPAQ